MKGTSKRLLQYSLVFACALLYSDMARPSSANERSVEANSNFCIDVGVPPGSGYEWVFQMPRVIPSSYRTEIPGRSVDGGHGGGGGGGTGMGAGLVLDVFSYAKIITSDIVTHLDWMRKRQKELFTGGDPKEIYTAHGNKSFDKYPPKIPKDVLWLALAGYLRHLLHPSNATLSDCVAYLVYLGDVSIEAGAWAQSEPSLKDLVNAIEKLVPDAPNTGPELKSGKNLYENMMLRLAWEDLATAYPFSFEQKFASRLELLGEDGIPFVIEATNSSHLFLKRNATLQLNRYVGEDPEPSALKKIREIFLSEKDACVKVRALDGLVRAKDNATVDNILKILDSEDKLLQPNLIYAMGMIGDQKAVEPICKKLEKSMGDYDILVAGVQALGRLKFKDKGGTQSSEDNRVIALLKQIEKEADKFKDPQPGMRPDTQDDPIVFTKTLKESVWLALAAMAQKEYLKHVEDNIKKNLAQFKVTREKSKEIEHKMDVLQKQLKGLDPKSQQYRQVQQQIGMLRSELWKFTRSKDVVRNFCQLKVVYFIVDMLSDLNEYEIIKGIIQVGEESVASYALTRYFNKKDGKGANDFKKDKTFLRSLVTMDTDRSQVASAALGILFDVDEKEAKEAAQQIINGYPGNIPPEQPPTSGILTKPVPSPEAKRFIVAFALKLASENGKKQDASKLKMIIENEEKERDKKKDPKSDPNQNPLAAQSNPIIVPPAPLLEYALLELGRLKDTAYEEYLIKYAKNMDSDARAEACFAIAALGSKKCKEALVDLLDDSEGWIRFCAYKALAGLANIKLDDKDYIADWLYGNDSSRKDPIKKWRDWLAKNN